MEEDYGGDIANLDCLLSAAEITFDILWAIFEPNTLAYSFEKHTEQDGLLLVRGVEYETDPRTKIRYLGLDCDMISCDGKTFGMANVQRCQVREYKGVSKIRNLSVFPLKYHPKANAIYEFAVQRGKKFVRMATHAIPHSYHGISGPAMAQKRMGDEDVIMKFNVRLGVASTGFHMCSQ